MNRNLLYNVVTVDGVKELDYLSGPSSIPLKRPARYYRMTSAESMRPDILSFGFYQQEIMWWVVCFANDIVDVQTQLIPGMILTIPDYQDVVEFFKAWRKR